MTLHMDGLSNAIPRQLIIAPEHLPESPVGPGRYGSGGSAAVAVEGLSPLCELPVGPR